MRNALICDNLKNNWQSRYWCCQVQMWQGAKKIKIGVWKIHNWKCLWKEMIICLKSKPFSRQFICLYIILAVKVKPNSFSWQVWVKHQPKYCLVIFTVCALFRCFLVGRKTREDVELSEKTLVKGGRERGGRSKACKWVCMHAVSKRWYHRSKLGRRTMRCTLRLFPVNQPNSK